MDGTPAQWKAQLEQVGQVEAPVLGGQLKPAANAGDLAIVRPFPHARLKTGDAVLCVMGGQVALCKVTQAWVVSGVTCLEVKGTDNTTHSITEEHLLGKMVEVRRGGAKLQMMAPTAYRLMDALKRLTSRPAH